MSQNKSELQPLSATSKRNRVKNVHEYFYNYFFCFSLVTQKIQIVVEMLKKKKEKISCVIERGEHTAQESSSSSFCASRLVTPSGRQSSQCP